jgi:hypothetical protein
MDANNVFQAVRGVVITRRTCAVNYDESIISNMTSVVRYVQNASGVYLYNKDSQLVAWFEWLSISNGQVGGITIPINPALPIDFPNIIDVVANTHPTTTTTTGGQTTTTTVITVPTTTVPVGPTLPLGPGPVIIPTFPTNPTGSVVTEPTHPTIPVVTIPTVIIPTTTTGSTTTTTTTTVNTIYSFITSILQGFYRFKILNSNLPVITVSLNEKGISFSGCNVVNIPITILSQTATKGQLKAGAASSTYKYCPNDNDHQYT